MSIKLENGDPLPAPYGKIPQRPREKPMQVLCLGLSRTGTMSLYNALGKLGYNCYHMVECSLDKANGSFDVWGPAVGAKAQGRKHNLQTAEDFDKVLWRYDAVSDIPAVVFAEELVAAYPEAKVILTERDPDKWLKSVERSFYRILESWSWTLLEVLDAEHGRPYVPLLRNPLKIWTNGDWKNREALKKGFLRHNQHLRDIVPKERLLVYHASQGWEPLCNFLERPIPEVDFPNVNHDLWAANLHDMIGFMRWLAVAGKAAKVIIPLGVVGLSWFVYQRLYSVN